MKEVRVQKKVKREHDSFSSSSDIENNRSVLPEPKPKISYVKQKQMREEEEARRPAKCCGYLPMRVGLGVLAVFNLANLYGLYLGIITGLDLYRNGSSELILT